MKKLIALTVLSASLFTACSSVDAYTGEEKVNNKTKGATMGAVLGAVVGGIAKGKDGALAGAAAGGLAGLGYGAYLDKQEAELRTELEGSGVGVEREGDELQLILPGNITFASSSSDIKTDFKSVLNSIAKVAAKYKKTNLKIVGHTDSTGALNYNMLLSKERSRTVKDYLVYKGVKSGRIITQGVGPKLPITSNSTAEGRAKNRRVEISFLEVTGEEY